jgi:glycine amidinotransferase
LKQIEKHMALAPHSFDEWTALREVVVGAAEGYSVHHLDNSFKLFYLSNIENEIESRGRSVSYIEIAPRILDELIEDLEAFVSAIVRCGVRVHRPERSQNAGSISSPFWTSRPTPPLNIRDQTLVLGNTIVETAPHVRARYFENDYLKPVFYNYFAAGGNWISMPKPVLARDSLDPQYFIDHQFDLARCIGEDDSKPLPGLPYELVFDGAQCIRLGADILVNVANRNHELGYMWLDRIFSSQFRLHRVFQMADNHIDSTVMPLKPGVLLLRSRGFLACLPPAFKSWDIVIAPEPREAQFPSYESEGLEIASKFIDMNVLSIDENSVVVNSLYPELIAELERRHFLVIPVRHRHPRLFGGGFHCFTLDCVRDGGLESYL